MHVKKTLYRSFGLITILALLIAAIPVSMVAADANEVDPTVQSGGDRLVALQNNDGSWDWPLDDGDPDSASPANTIGPIAKGLAETYRVTGDSEQMTALAEAGAFLLTKTNNFSPSDGYLAGVLDEVFGGTTYVDFVNANFYDKLAAGEYDRNGEGTLYSTASYVQLIRDARASLGNLGAWDIGMGLVGAAACGADTNPWIDGVKAELNEMDSDANYDVLGLAGALYGLAIVDETFDPTTGSFEAASSIEDLAAVLASYQIENGGFAWNSQYVIPDDDNETIQETAYAVLALNEVDRATYLSNILGAADFMMDVQLGTGGWEGYVGEGENNEITGEALWGINVAYPQLWVCPSGDCGHVGVEYASIQSAIDAAPEGATINVLTGEYLEELVIGKSVTILGPNAEISPNTETRIAEAVVAPVDQPDAQNTAITFSAGDVEVVIKGLKFDMSGTTDESDRFVLSISQHDNVLTFEHNIFTGAPGTINGYWYITGNTTPATINVIDNYFFNNGDSNGISLWGTDQTINISSNVWEDNQAWAVNLNNVTGTIADNKIIDLVDNGPLWYEDQLGFLFANAVNLDVTGNEFSGLPGTAIRIYDSVNGRLAISGNTFTETGSSEYATIRISDGADLSAVTVESNSFVDNSILIQNGSTTDTLDVSPNWWGSAAGPSVANIDGEAEYSPWCGDSACSFILPDENGVVTLSGDINVPGGIIIDQPGLTYLLEDGTVIENESPCFVINADYTTIKAASPLGAVCKPTDDSNGIDVNGDRVNVVIEGLDFDGENGTNGIDVDGVVTDLVVSNNYFHGFTNAGMFFAAEPAGTVQIQGNLFMDNDGNGIEAGALAIPAEFNAWGSYDGPETANGGDGISASVDADPWTHVDLSLESSGTDYADQVVQGSQITYQVKGDFANTIGAEFTLEYPSELSFVSTSLGGLFDTESITDTGSELQFLGYQIGDDTLPASPPLNGTGLQVFTVTFEGDSLGKGLVLNFDETSDGFTMAPGYGPSTNIYAAALNDVTDLEVISLPTLTSSDIEGPYVAGIQQEFHVTLDNPASGGEFDHVRVNFVIEDTLLSDIYSLEYFDGTVWQPISLSQDGADVVGHFGPTGGFPMGAPYNETTKLRVTFMEPGSYNLIATLDDLDVSSTLATLTATATVGGEFDVTGTVSMQGRTVRSGVPMVLTSIGAPSYGPYSATSTNVISNNLLFTGVNGGSYGITTNQARYLNVTAALGKQIMVSDDYNLSALELKGGNAVWTDNVINVQDASTVGSDYGEINAISLDADVNFDDRVNIQDLALVGGNFDLTSADVYAGWTP